MSDAKIEGKAKALTDAALPGSAWLKTVSESPSALYSNFNNIYHEGFGMVARTLQMQADFAMKLAACKGPAEALACQIDFLRSASATYAEEARRGFQSLRSALPSA
ncbi:phasin family protein [Roseococcus pinisoli]|uniref:Phasin family protein n=1 Tax=Roseococcus pinisoli TaxID=2835040 RepID=A0ABS5QDJ3_9PROT|nr:phasin family protein [Roseococcus pinisoli]MBS7811025.1 phasin family protein [Roseococcus pinisoli]